MGRISISAVGKLGLGCSSRHQQNTGIGGGKWQARLDREGSASASTEEFVSSWWSWPQVLDLQPFPITVSEPQAQGIFLDNGFAFLPRALWLLPIISGLGKFPPVHLGARGPLMLVTRSAEYSCLENPMDRGAWGAAVLRLTQSLTRLKRLNTHAYKQF